MFIAARPFMSSTLTCTVSGTLSAIEPRWRSASLTARAPIVASYGSPSRGIWQATASVKPPLTGLSSAASRMRVSGSKRHVPSPGAVTEVTLMPAGTVSVTAPISPCAIWNRTRVVTSTTPGWNMAKVLASQKNATFSSFVLRARGRHVRRAFGAAPKTAVTSVPPAFSVRVSSTASSERTSSSFSSRWSTTWLRRFTGSASASVHVPWRSSTGSR